ncbi:hypothetical protein LOH54_08440 [Sulfurimonas sp. HSL-3221]|uniref:hypothetical protein n=1 Tax=Sulfurimonadaceae TaxID=2771471 RepID=UPI001E64EA38|nr:hypothetical protein [Sulfurimonas sp. HSL-3221]UFS61690.1 hypothetical protein LOH54_08440 [Sulfurimonas sp. HSL-3221]
MTTLTQKEREDLQSVFNSISDNEPTRGAKLCRIKNIIFLYIHSRFHHLLKKRVSYQK